MTSKTSITLFEPINVDGVDRASIELRRLRTKDIRQMEAKGGGSTDKMAFVIQRLSGWPPEAVDELDVADIAAIGKIIENFTEKTPPE